MAHRKSGGTASNLKDSPGQRLGIKRNSGARVTPGVIILRQRGKKYRAGENTKYAKDFSIFATADGVVRFKKKKVTKFSGNKGVVTTVMVMTK